MAPWRVDTTRLEALREKFLRIRPSLVSSGQAGRWALVGEGRLVTCFDTEIEAIRAGYDTCELGGFLVQQVAEREPVLQSSWNISA